MIINILQEINEGRSEKAQGSSKGREKYTSKKGSKGTSVKSRKSRVKVYDTISAALNSAAPVGTIFSTKAADRLYVISKAGWGKKSSGRIAKGFTPGSATPNASWPSIKSHSIRTSLKHGGSKSKRLRAKYGPGQERPEEKRYASKKVLKKKKKIKEAQCPSSSKIEALLPMLKMLLRKALLKEDIGVLEGILISLREVVRPPGLRRPKGPGDSTSDDSTSDDSSKPTTAGGEKWSKITTDWLTKYNNPGKLRKLRSKGYRLSQLKSQAAMGPRHKVPPQLLPRRAALRLKGVLSKQFGDRGGSRHYTA